MHVNLTGRSKPAAAVALATIALAVAACQTPAGDTTTAPPSSAAVAPPPVAVSSLTASSSPEASASAAASPNPTPTDTGLGGTPAPATATDPCDLLTKDEASTLMGKTLGAGASTVIDNTRVCTWKKGTSEVKLFLAPPAPDVTTATTYWDAERSQLPAGVKVTDLQMFDRAAYGSGAGAGISVSALFAIKGTQFFDLFCGFPACSGDASVTAAQLIGDRLP